MRAIIYKLNEQGTPIPMKSEDRDDVLRWATFMEGDNNRVVKRSLLFHSPCLIGTTCSSK